MCDSIGFASQEEVDEHVAIVAIVVLQFVDPEIVFNIQRGNSSPHSIIFYVLIRNSALPRQEQLLMKEGMDMFGICHLRFQFASSKN